MNKNKILKINGTTLDQEQLKNHLEKIATNHNLVNKSQKNTYPIPYLEENFKIIEEVYNILNEHLKLGISIHPAGEWLLDNFYIIEETVKQIKTELPLKKYINFLGIGNGPYKGFARIYVLASEIVAYTDNKIEKNDLEIYLTSYQTKKNLSMEEIWNIGLFLNIAIIENIREICEKIYTSQMQKYKAENIVERLVENKQKSELLCKNNSSRKISKKVWEDMQYPFIEYMSYILKRYGKKGYSYLNALEETVELAGMTVSDVIKKEHFDIAVRKVSIGNSITSIKKIQRINFLEIFEKVNGVEELLKQDPANVYDKMDNKTKEYYRNKIKEISKKTKISEIYITRKMLEIANTKEIGSKQSHIGYYLIDKGVSELYIGLKRKKKDSISEKSKTIIYICFTTFITMIFSIIIGYLVNKMTNNIYLGFIGFILFLIPVSELVIQLIQYILSKIVKPKLIPKLDLTNGIDEENTTMVVIPTIIKSKEKVKELMRKLEVYYLANESSNIYFTLLGDCSESTKKEEDFDNEVIEEGKKQVDKLNQKYKVDEKELPIFNFIYRERKFNKKENSYLGWERKRGMLNQFNEYILGNIQNPFRENTIENKIEKEQSKIRERLEKIKYIITLDADTDLILNSAFELIGAMAHILNKPVIDDKRNIVIDGYGIMQPRVGINLDISYKSLFTKIFAGAGGIDSYTNAISDIYQDNFKEGIFTGKGIYDVAVFSKVLKGQIPENTVLSHDLLEGCYLRCGLVSDIMLMDGYPTKYNSFMNRLSRWIRGDWQIIEWLFGNVKNAQGKSEKNPLNELSKFKILDNLRRSTVEIFLLLSSLLLGVIASMYKTKVWFISAILVLSVFIPIIIDVILKKEYIPKQKTFTPYITGIKGSFIAGIINFSFLPYKAYISIDAIIRAIYRLTYSKQNLLEWTTSEEAEKKSGTSLSSYIKQMAPNYIIGILTLIFLSLLPINIANIIMMFVAILWIIAPVIAWYISIENIEENKYEKLKSEDKKYILALGQKTWEYFNEFMNEENNYLPPDNYQEDRKEKIVKRTSSTNIGLRIISNCFSI